MRRNLRFWRNVAVIGVVHGAVLFGLARWGGEAKKATAAEILWMDAGAMAVSRTPAEPPEEPPAIPALAPIEEAQPAPVAIEEPGPSVEPIASEVPVPTPTATAPPTPKLSPTPERTASPKASPKPSVTPKKTLLAKAASPKPKSKPSQKASPASSPASARSATSAKPTVIVNTPLTAGAGGGTGSGSSKGSAEAAGYYRMLHERFSSEWEQPMSVVATGAKMSALVKVRIEQDGRISEFSIARSSGNVLVDESIAEIAKRVKKVDPLPGGMGNGSHHDVMIGFGFNADQ